MRHIWFIRNRELQKEMANITSSSGVKIVFERIKEDEHLYFIIVKDTILATLSKDANILLNEYMCRVCGRVQVEMWDKHIQTARHISNKEAKQVGVDADIHVAEEDFFKYCPNCGEFLTVKRDEDGKSIGAYCEGKVCHYQVGDV